MAAGLQKKGLKVGVFEGVVVSPPRPVLGVFYPKSWCLDPVVGIPASSGWRGAGRAQRSRCFLLKRGEKTPKKPIPQLFSSVSMGPFAGRATRRPATCPRRVVVWLLAAFPFIPLTGDAFWGDFSPFWLHARLSPLASELGISLPPPALRRGWRGPLPLPFGGSPLPVSPCLLQQRGGRRGERRPSAPPGRAGGRQKLSPGSAPALGPQQLAGAPRKGRGVQKGFGTLLLPSPRWKSPRPAASPAPKWKAAAGADPLLMKKGGFILF